MHPQEMTIPRLEVQEWSSNAGSSGGERITEAADLGLIPGKRT